MANKENWQAVKSVMDKAKRATRSGQDKVRIPVIVLFDVIDICINYTKLKKAVHETFKESRAELNKSEEESQ